MKLSGKIAIVTGASGGIGSAVCRRLSADGATVAIVYRSGEARAQELAASLTAGGGQAQCFKADVSRPEACRVLIDDVVAVFGKVDILISNAGIEHFAKLEEITAADVERVFSVNVAGQLFATQAIVPFLPRGGRIVLTSSVSARFAVYNHTLYAASKAAISAMVLNLAPELGERGITINAIAPGGTATPMAEENAKRYTPPALRSIDPDILMKSINAVQRIGQPAEIAGAISFLVSDDASYITGSTLAVDGGAM